MHTYLHTFLGFESDSECAGCRKDIKYKTMNMNNSEIIKLCVPFLTYG